MNDGPDWPDLPGEPLLNTSDAVAPPVDVEDFTEADAEALLDALDGREPMTDAEVAEALIEYGPD